MYQQDSRSPGISTHDLELVPQHAAEGCKYSTLQTFLGAFDSKNPRKPERQVPVTPTNPGT